MRRPFRLGEARRASRTRPPARSLLALLILGLGLSSGLAGLDVVANVPAALDMPQFLSSLRVSFYQSVESPAATEETVALIQAAFPAPRDSWPPVVLAYYAALEGLRGKHAGALLDKLGHVTKAMSLIRRLPEDNPASLEIRFLRFSFFRQLPAFFGVRSTVGPDLEALVTMLEEGADPDVPRKIQGDIVVYLLDCREADLAQLQRLQRLRAAFAAGPEP
jgi:hypothetical protein